MNERAGRWRPDGSRVSLPVKPVGPGLAGDPLWPNAAGSHRLVSSRLAGRNEENKEKPTSLLRVPSIVPPCPSSAPSVQMPAL